MKYSDQNPPITCMMSQSTCYRNTRIFEPKGILWHSTGKNNPAIKRYVQPSDNDPQQAELLKILGKNQYTNDWNHVERNAGVHFFVGKLASGVVSSVQTMPWNYRPWGCGAGIKGSLNNTHIQFEICEDDLNNKEYFDKIYRESCEMTAYLCKKFNFNPMGTIKYNSITVPVIIDHVGSSHLGLGDDHSDVQHWFGRYGKTMDDVRKDVKALLESKDFSDIKTDDKELKSESDSYSDYIVKSGDSLSKIAQKFLGNSQRYKEIMDLNGLKSTVIRIGQELKIPGTSSNASTNTTSVIQVYTVVKGDTLSKISLKYLGDAKRYKEIMELNGLKTTVLQIGQKLKIKTT